jgi:hypothetical protein
MSVCLCVSLSVCLSVTFVDHAQSFERSLFGLDGRIICSIHPVIRKIKPDKKIPPESFSFPVPNAEALWKKILKSQSGVIVIIKV